MTLCAAPGADRVLKNIEEEPNVPGRISKIFFVELGVSFDSTTNPMQHLEKVVGNIAECALAGPSCTPSSNVLTRFASLLRLLEHEDLRRAGVSSKKLLQNPSLVDRITAMPLGNRRGFVWAALFDEIRREMENGVEVGAILNRLGLSETLTEPMYQVAYDRTNVRGTCHVPTVLDAGSNYQFRCALKKAKAGKTWPCSGTESGFSEYVHSSCLAKRPTIKIYPKVKT
jgi:hypothetical protein